MGSRSIFQNPIFYKGFFSILLVATFMTFFELMFYIFIVRPQTSNAVNTILNTLTFTNIGLESIPEEVEKTIYYGGRDQITKVENDVLDITNELKIDTDKQIADMDKKIDTKISEIDTEIDSEINNTRDDINNQFTILSDNTSSFPTINNAVVETQNNINGSINELDQNIDSNIQNLETEIDNELDDLKNNIGDQFNDINGAIDANFQNQKTNTYHIGDAFNTFISDFLRYLGYKTEDVAISLENREQILMNKISIFSYAIIGFEIILLIILMIVIYYKVLSKQKKMDMEISIPGENSNRKVKMRYTVASSVITVMLLIMFQILFYFFGLKFQYLGSGGTEEIQYMLLMSMKEDLEKKVPIEEPFYTQEDVDSCNFHWYEPNFYSKIPNRILDKNDPNYQEYIDYVYGYSTNAPSGIESKKPEVRRIPCREIYRSLEKEKSSQYPKELNFSKLDTELKK